MPPIPMGALQEPSAIRDVGDGVGERCEKGMILGATAEGGVVDCNPRGPGCITGATRNSTTGREGQRREHVSATNMRGAAVPRPYDALVRTVDPSDRVSDAWLSSMFHVHETRECVA